MRMNKYLFALSLIVVLVVIALVVAWSKGGGTGAEGKTELLVSAATSLKDSLLALQAEFEKQNPAIRLTFNFAASGTLQKQIEQGAPADVFISAGSKQMKALVDGGYVDSASQEVLLTNELVMVMSSNNTMSLAGDIHKALLRPEFKTVAIGIPESVPAGMYAKQALEYQGIYNDLLPKLVQAKDVGQVLTYVETGNADAGFVYRTDALTSKKVRIMLTVAPKAHDPITYPASIIKETKHLKEATSFYKYLQGKEASAIFVKYGFKLPAKM